MEENNQYRSTIVVRTEVEFIHRYKDAPQEVNFLQNWHRHMLQLEIEMEVTHLDRELEFIMVKRCIDGLFSNNSIKVYYVDSSCETICKQLIGKLKEIYGDRDMVVTACEDGENAGRVYYSKAKTINSL